MKKSRKGRHSLRMLADLAEPRNERFISLKDILNNNKDSDTDEYHIQEMSYV